MKNRFLKENSELIKNTYSARALIAVVAVKYIPTTINVEFRGIVDSANISIVILESWINISDNYYTRAMMSS